MTHREPSFVSLLRRALVAAAALASAAAFAQELNPARRHPDAAADIGDSQQIIVRFKAGGVDNGRAQALSATKDTDQVASLAARSGMSVKQARKLTSSIHVLEVEPLAGGETLASRLERLRADASVEYAEPDLRRYPHALPNDPLYTGQWYLQNRPDTPAAIDAEHAWDVTTGTSDVVIAVLDTGVLFEHPDLGRAASSGRLLPGYDFVSNVPTANDGDGRDADPTDPGDWVSSSEAQSGTFAGCDPSNSSWHGTRTAGIIGARTNNSIGVAGVTWSPRLLPVRVLGKCGGRDSDILAGMLWAAGIHVDGVPDNPTPAKVENMSLGSAAGFSCPASYRDVIAQVSARGTLVVVSAGNEGGPVDVPANCPGAAGIAGLRHAGTKVGYSSLGPQIAVAAPAGNCVNTVAGSPCLFSIDTTDNLGATTVGAHDYTNQINANFGTSFSAPIASGIVGLMASVNGNLRSADLLARLREGAVKPFPVSTDPTVPQCHVPSGQNDVQNAECTCTTSTCGAGMANAPGALAAALRPIAIVTLPGSMSAGQSVVLSASASAAANGRTISSYEWSVLCGIGAVSTTGGSDTTVVAPADGNFTVRVKVTDDTGRQDSLAILVGSTSAQIVTGTACPITVAVTPATATVRAGDGTQAFTATVTNAQDTSVVWSVNGVTGGNATFGTISTAGQYVAPATLPASTVVTIAAAANANPVSTATAVVTLTAPPVAPASAGGGGGGGGGGAGLDLLLLCAALLAGGRLSRRRA